MKTLILALLLVPSLLFGQEQEQPGPPEAQTEFMVYEFDIRCLAPLEWSVTLIEARQNDVTVDVIIKRLVQDYDSGSLQEYTPETIEYMLTIISTVFSNPIHTKESFLAVLHKVEALCVAYVENEEEKASKSVVSKPSP